jgi:hypothetical protein
MLQLKSGNSRGKPSSLAQKDHDGAGAKIPCVMKRDNVPNNYRFRYVLTRYSIAEGTEMSFAQIQLLQQVLRPG